MKEGSVRVSLVLNDEKQFKRWKKYKNAKGYGSFSSMVRNTVEAAIKRENKPDKIMEPIQDAISGLYKLLELTHEEVEILSMRLLADKENNSEIVKAAREILKLLPSGENKTFSEFVGMFNYNRKIISGALTLLIDLKLIGTRRGDKMQKEEKNEEK